jgi:Phage related hypothetical protein (DUF1799)
LRRIPSRTSCNQQHVSGSHCGRPHGKLREAARAVYTPQASDAEIRAAGFEPEDFSEDDDAYVWPENWPAFQLFTFLSTQWRTGFAGPTGLDYLAMYRAVDELDLTPEDRRDVIDCVRVMEAAALEFFQEQRVRAEQNKKS